LRIVRNSSGELSADPNDVAAFQLAQDRLRSDFSVGNGLFYTDDLFDALSNTIDVYESNGTTYLASVYSPESTLATYRPETLKKCVTLVKQVAYVVDRIHRKGYLYLDIKPENVLVIEGYATRIQLFDFDSLLPIRAKGGASQFAYGNTKLSYSKGFVPIELQTAKLNKLGAYTDVYGIGALLFYMLFGRTPEASDCETGASYDYSAMAFQDKNYNDRLYFSLNSFFHNALANFYLDRYQTMEQALAELDEIERLADTTEIYLRSTDIISPDGVIGRKSEIASLEEWLNTDNSPIIFVTGMGGIGKSTMVRAFVTQNKARIKSVLYLSYKDSFERTLTDDEVAHVNTVEKEDSESLSEYYTRKLKAFRKAVEGTSALLVIDNYEGGETAEIKRLLSVGWKVIIISRQTPLSRVYPTIKVSAFEKPDDLHALFASNYGRDIAEEDIPYVDNIIGRVAGHTFAIELIGKQIASSHISICEASSLVDKHGFSEIGVEKIAYEQDAEASLDTIKSVLTALHKAGDMSERKYSIMKAAALFDEAGVDICVFHECLGLQSKDDVNELVLGGWLQLEGGCIMVHPLIKETIHCWAWNHKSKADAKALMLYIYKEIKVEAQKEEYPLKLLKLIDYAVDQFPKHPRLKKAFDSLTARNGVLGAVVKERYERRNDSKVTDHIKVAQFVRLAEGILHSCKREEILLNSEIYCELLYSTVLSMPRHREEYILNGACELIRSPYARNGFTLMKLYGCIMSVYQERQDFQNATNTIREAETTARKFGHTQVLAMYYNLLSEYYDALLNGAYASDEEDEMEIIHKMLDATDKAIRYARRSHKADSKQILARNLLGKATILMRVLDGKPDEIRKLLSEARHFVETESQEFSELRGHFYMVLAWYCALLSQKAEEAADCMVVARYISRQNSATDLDFIDDAVIPCADVYRNLGNFAQAAKFLMEAIDLCEKYPGTVPYIRKKMELCLHLLDICFEWEKYDVCRELIAEIEAENEKNLPYDIRVEIPLDIRSQLLEDD